MTTVVADVAVVGGGHHGLVAAAALADAGWAFLRVEIAVSPPRSPARDTTPADARRWQRRCRDESE
jgi:glycine/D-amino acid oxidase-like deaminating enzyme